MVAGFVQFGFGLQRLYPQSLSDMTTRGLEVWIEYILLLGFWVLKIQLYFNSYDCTGYHIHNR